MEISRRDLRLPKRKVQVELALVDRPPRPVQVFVAEYQERSWRRQEVADLLEQDQRFLPALDLEDGTWFLFNKQQVLWVAVAPDAAAIPTADDEELELFEQHRVVRVDLAGGGALTGELLYSPAADGPRVLDHLNASRRFLRLWQEGRLLLVNQIWVQRVVETEGD